MTVYSFFIFDRHTECIYQRRWTQVPTSDASKRESVGSTTLNAQVDVPAPAPPAPLVNGTSHPPKRTALEKRKDDAKLLFGVIFSLRGMVRRLGGPNDEFISYSTGEYKMHYYETPTSLKFCMLTDLKTGNLRVVLHQIWANLYVEYVVRNPLSPVEHAGGVGVNNELFEMGLDRFVVSICTYVMIFLTLPGCTVAGLQSGMSERLLGISSGSSDDEHSLHRLRLRKLTNVCSGTSNSFGATTSS